jgi:hypothetical protein
MKYRISRRADADIECICDYAPRTILKPQTTSMNKFKGVGKRFRTGDLVRSATGNHLISIDGKLFDPSSDHLSFAYHQVGDMRELAKLRGFLNLESANFCASGLDDVGLGYVSDVPTIERLNLQDTRVTNEGLSVLERLSKLKYLRLKDNAQLSNECIPHLLKLKQLVNLQIHETSIDQYGLNQLTVMGTLTDICIDVCGDNHSFVGLLNLSARMPRCRILAKGKGEFWQGEFSGRWDQ